MRKLMAVNQDDSMLIAGGWSGFIYAARMAALSAKGGDLNGMLYHGVAEAPIALAKDIEKVLEPVAGAVAGLFAAIFKPNARK